MELRRPRRRARIVRLSLTWRSEPTGLWLVLQVRWGAWRWWRWRKRLECRLLLLMSDGRRRKTGSSLWRTLVGLLK